MGQHHRQCGKPACTERALHASHTSEDGTEKSCPRCSCEAGRLVFKPCPTAFGADAGRKSGSEIQSWCMVCREWKASGDAEKVKARHARQGLKFLDTIAEIFARASRCTLPYLVRYDDIVCPRRGRGQLLGAEDGKHGLKMMVLFEREIAWMGHDEYNALKAEAMS